MNAKIGKIRKVALRELWKREDINFTKWLEENIDYLTDVLDFDITIESREKKIGPFSVDLYGEDENGDKVIIENQLEKTDHTHLGQILTYLINLEAKTAIWISSDPVEEHQKAIGWLNETTPDDISFYLVKLEAIQIGDEPTAAPLFTVIKTPSVERKKIGTERKEHAQRHIFRKKFWTQFIDEINKKHDMCKNIRPSVSAWISVALGRMGLPLYIVISKRRVRTEIYIDTGNKEENKRIFDIFFAKKDQIESVFEGNLEWKRLEDNQVSKIESNLHDVDASNENDWEQINDFLIDNAIRMYDAFKSHVGKL